MKHSKYYFLENKDYYEICEVIQAKAFELLILLMPSFFNYSIFNVNFYVYEHFP